MVALLALLALGLAGGASAAEIIATLVDTRTQVDYANERGVCEMRFTITNDTAEDLNRVAIPFIVTAKGNNPVTTGENGRIENERRRSNITIPAGQTLDVFDTRTVDATCDVIASISIDIVQTAQCEFGRKLSEFQCRPLLRLASKVDGIVVSQGE